MHFSNSCCFFKVKSKPVWQVLKSLAILAHNLPEIKLTVLILTCFYFSPSRRRRSREKSRSWRTFVEDPTSSTYRQSSKTLWWVQYLKPLLAYSCVPFLFFPCLALVSYLVPSTAGALQNVACSTKWYCHGRCLIITGLVFCIKKIIKKLLNSLQAEQCITEIN